MAGRGRLRSEQAAGGDGELLLACHNAAAPPCTNTCTLDLAPLPAVQERAAERKVLKRFEEEFIVVHALGCNKQVQMIVVAFVEYCLGSTKQRVVDH